MPSPALISYAVLKVNWDVKGQDYIGSFMPFVLEAIFATPAKYVALPDIQAGLLRDFGLRMPLNTVKTMLTRAKKLGYLRPNHGAYLKVEGKNRDTGFAARRAQAVREFVALTDAFTHFCKEQYSYEVDGQSAEAALYQFLSHHGDMLLDSSLNGTSVNPPEGKAITERFLVNSFLRHVHEREPNLSKYLDSILKGTILANSIMYQDVGSLESHFKGVRIFFDTKFIIQALGLEYDAQQAACLELLELLRLEQATLCCFDHTYQELSDVLHSLSFRMKSEQSNESPGTLSCLIDKGWTSSDVERVIAELPERLDQMKIVVEPHPPYIEALGVDEVAFKKRLLDSGAYRTSKDPTIDRDIASVTAIYRLRGGRPALTLEQCQAVFVTTNTPLVRVTRDFSGFEQIRSVAPLAVTDAVMTHLVWLKRPTVAPELPMTQVIASCYAALEPGEQLWRNYLEKINGLKEQHSITPEQFAVLRYSNDARLALMDMTLGEPEEFSVGTVEQIIRRVEGNIRADERNKREAVERELAATQRRHLDVLSKIDGLTVKVAKAISGVVMLLSCLALAIGAYLSSPFYPGATVTWWRILAPALQGIVLLFGLYNWWSGKSLRQFFDAMVEKISASSSVRLRKWLGSDSADKAA